MDNFYIENYLDLDGSVNSVVESKIKLFDNSDVTVRILPNGDKFFFFELDNSDGLNIIFPSFKISYDLDGKYQKPKFDNRYGEILVSGWQSLNITESHQYIISKQYEYKTLSDEKSYVQDLIAEHRVCFEKYENKHAIKIISSNEKISFCVVVTDKQFFEKESNLEDYLSLYYSELLSCNAACSTWYTHKALYTKTAASILPYTMNGYQVSIHHSSKKELVHLYRVNRDRFIFNLLVNAAYTILTYQDSKDGMFLTTFTSKWLFDRYGICAPYVDTRLNETFNNALIDIKKLTNCFESIDLFENYANFLKKNSNNVHKSTNGLFYPDYFDVDLKIITHTSLNHQLGIANYLLRVFHKTSDKIYLLMYNQILNFLKDTYLKWGADNGDLYYEANTVNGQLQFKGQDYVFVTLSDLLFLLKNHYEYFGSFISEIVYLINLKLKFLVENGFDPEFSKKIASGEGDNDKKHVVRLLKELGFYFLLEIARRPDNSYLNSIKSIQDIDLNKEIPSAWIIYLKAKQCYVTGDIQRADFYYRLNHLLHNSSIPYKAEIGKNSLFAYGGIGVIIHQSAKIGERCNFGSNVVIGGDHTGVPTIGHDVFIATGAKIIGGIVIEDGAIIGANAIVKKPVAAFNVVAGIPAKVVSKITATNFEKYSGFYWCKNSIEKSKLFCDWYVSRKKMKE